MKREENEGGDCEKLASSYVKDTSELSLRPRPHHPEEFENRALFLRLDLPSSAHKITYFISWIGFKKADVNIHLQIITKYIDNKNLQIWY